MRERLREAEHRKEATATGSVAKQLRTRLGQTPFFAPEPQVKVSPWPAIGKSFQKFFNPINRVVSPAMLGATVAWLTVAAAYEIASQHRMWMPATGELVEMWLCTFLAAVAISPWKRLKPLWASILSTAFGCSFALALSYGRFQRAHWPWSETTPTTLDFAASSFLGYLVLVGVAGVVWIPAVLLSAQRYRSLARDTKESRANV